jgi:hypothetical protein
MFLEVVAHRQMCGPFIACSRDLLVRQNANIFLCLLCPLMVERAWLFLILRVLCPEQRNCK